MPAKTQYLAAALSCLIESASNPGDGSQLTLDLKSAREALAAHDALPGPMACAVAEVREFERYRAESYAVADTGEIGWCVKYGDDTICDVYSGGQEMAETIAALLSAEV
ncbi:MAG TPA: hypothetical protein VFS02_22310 [Telluria sp.]|nr:hypothetical protein [Telluria sp.]